MSNKIELTKEQFEKLKQTKRIIGSGVDGTIYEIDRNTIYKIYHNLGPEIIHSRLAIYDSEGVNISNPSIYRDIFPHMNNPINYIDYEGVILSKERAIIKAIEKQSNIKLTNLPSSIIKVDRRVVGCTYKKYNTIMGIYASSIFNINIRKHILYDLLIKIKELLDNNIYPVTLCQKNILFPYIKKDSNILLSYKLEPLLVDLDGISAYYADTFNENKYILTLLSLSRLILEILTRMDLSYEYLEENKEEFYQLLQELKISDNLIEKYYNSNYFDIDEIESILIKK